MFGKFIIGKAAFGKTQLAPVSPYVPTVKSPLVHRRQLKQSLPKRKTVTG